ncbi:hypothetical protein [Clostridium tetani]|uniref:hypothetical protein n=1 Tax=Clostridium tetani TaxID=1513 RepID=UPI000AB42082|nr:hypothetical protein [Clostridium tetani]
MSTRADKAVIFSSSKTSKAFPKIITLSYLMLNLLGKSSVLPTTEKDTFFY